MQTKIDPQLTDNPSITEAEGILRSCVHCGFCTATCPTYQLLGNELDSPRGRIYLIKGLLEGGAVTDRSRLHLDRCLTCRSCETTCPSGVKYGRLIDIGRQLLEQRVPRSATEQLTRRAMLQVLPYTRRINVALKIGRIVRPLLPAGLKGKVPVKKRTTPWPRPRHARRMIVLQGCVQPLTAPNTNAAAARVLDRLGISLITASGAGCCGALNQHNSDQATAREMVRRNIDAWWPLIEAGAEAIVMTASGCGLMVKEYGELLKHDPVYGKKAARISAMTRDISEILHELDLDSLAGVGHERRVAYHSSCTLQHGQKLSGAVESILQRCGYHLTPVANGHLCCGAAGTYTLTQPELSQQLLNNKLDALQQHQPEVIATANVGCQMHLETGATVPVKHWIELLDNE